VNLNELQISINDGSIVLKVDTNKERAAQLAYAIAYATKHCPMHKDIKGLTWEWLSHAAQPDSNIKWMGKKADLRVTYNQQCRENIKWSIQSDRYCDQDWYVNDETSLARRLFMSERLTDTEMHILKPNRRCHRCHLPDNVEISLIPEEGDLWFALESAKAASRMKADYFTDIGPDTETNQAMCHSNSNGSAQTVKGEYPNTLSAVNELVDRFPEVEEVAVVAYIGKLVINDLRWLKRKWYINHFKLLLLDLDELDKSLKGRVPISSKAIEIRRREACKAMDELAADENIIIKNTKEVRYIIGQPSLRTLLVKPKKDDEFTDGFLSIYQQRNPMDLYDDYSATGVKVLRLSSMNGYEKNLLDSIRSWFKYLWDKGSYKKGMTIRSS
jgi:hypothetical protein